MWVDTNRSLFSWLFILLLDQAAESQTDRGGWLLFSAKYRNLLECVTMTWTNKRSFYSLLIILECLGGGVVTHCERISKFVQKSFETQKFHDSLYQLTKYAHPPFYSVPSIFEVFRNLVREIWFKKSGSANSDFFSGSRKVVDQKKKSEFAEPLF